MAAKKKPAAAEKAEKMTKRAKAAEESEDVPQIRGNKDERIAGVLAMINARMKSTVLKRADEANTSYLLRRPTGILSLDIALGGGFPASAPSVIVGPDSAGKDYMLYRMMGEQQRLHGDSFAGLLYMTEFKLDKAFARKSGFIVGYTDEELDEADAARQREGRPPLTAEERAELQHQIGQVVIIDDVIADYAFDAVIDAIAANEFHIVAVNSIGFLQTLAKEETDSFSEFAQQSNEAVLLTKFMTELALTLNRTPPNGTRNETAVVLINQMRTRRDARIIPGRPATDKDKMQPAAGAMALKHGKAVELTLFKGPSITDQSDPKNPEILGREVRWEITKGKLGTHDNIKGVFNYLYEHGADTIGDMLKVGVSLEVVKRAGSWHEWISEENSEMRFKVNSEANARRFLMEHPEVHETFRKECLRAARITCRYK